MLDKLRKGLHDKILELRNLECFIYTRRFERIFEEGNKEEIGKLIKSGDRKALMLYLKGHSTLSFGEMGFAELKQIARKMGMPNWSRHPKWRLIQELEKCQKAKV